jgi:hypothetical protein
LLDAGQRAVDAQSATSVQIRQQLEKRFRRKMPARSAAFGEDAVGDGDVIVNVEVEGSPAAASGSTPKHNAADVCRAGAATSLPR